MYGSEMSRPGSPNSTSMTTVNLASITRRANVMTAGVMPGISAMTITRAVAAGVDRAGARDANVNVSARNPSMAGVFGRSVAGCGIGLGTHHYPEVAELWSGF